MIEYLRNVSSVLRFIANDPEKVNDFADSLSNTQFESKRWLVQSLVKLNIQPRRIVILGGWYGSYLIPMLNEAFRPSYIALTDKEPNVLTVAEHLHDCFYQTKSNVRTAVLDVETQIDQLNSYDFDLVINTSCEHMNGLDRIRTSTPNTIYAFQSCDKGTDPGHINPASSTEQLREQVKLDHVLFAGRYNLGHKSRFMVIGQRH